MANIFLLEDDRILSKGISIALKKDGHTVTAVYGFTDALQQYPKLKVDLFLLDINLPDGSGLELCRKIRETSETPILFLTANDTEENMLKGFGAGCDDYIAKPFPLAVLRKKVQAVLKRTINDNSRILYKNLEINTDKCLVLLCGEEVHLTATEYRLLLCLAQEKEQIKTLISDISHQIKTPVAAANTFAELLGDGELTEEERTKYIAALQLSLGKLTFLTDSLIKMSRLESGLISLKPKQNSLNEIVLQAVSEQTFEAVLDFNWTAEAISNVIDNTVKYTPEGGSVRLQITEYPSYLRLDISDSGVGIPEEEQAKVFGRFYRGKHAAGIDGVGIGLYLTREIIGRQNGYIKVSSDANGSTFSLFLKKY